MLKFTKARIKWYKKWSHILPEAFEILQCLKNMQKEHPNNPFINNNEKQEFIRKKEIFINIYYTIFRKLEARLLKEGLIKEII